MFMKEPHTALFVAPTGVGKTHLALSLLEAEYRNHHKRRQPLLELVISGRHRGHSLWLLTQLYTAIPNNIRRQAKMLYVWYPKNRMDLNTIHEENDVIGPEELARVKAQLKWGKHTCLIMRMEHPRAYMIR